MKNIYKKLKSKNVESSSRQKQPMVEESEESEEETMPQQEPEEMEEDEQRPEWKVGTSLHTLPREWQTILYREKLGERDHIKKQLIGERKTLISDFRGFGMVECFERMGWNAGLEWNNKDSSKVYQDGIVEWMGTLEQTLGTNPPETMKLTGTVNGKKVVMSFAALDKIVKFDLGTRPFHYLREEILNGTLKGPNWTEMINELFTFTPDQINLNPKLERFFLKPLPKLIMTVLSWNVYPRKGDKTMVRNYEVVILHALVTGNPALSIRQIIMASVWDARNKANKTIVPHARLITSLIKAQKAMPREPDMVELPQTPISLALLCRNSDWNYEERPMGRILKDSKVDHSYLIAPNQGFTREQVIADLEGGVEARRERAEIRAPRASGSEIRQAEIPRAAIQRPDFYDQWTPFEKQMWDLNALQVEESRAQAEATRRRHEEQRMFERGMVYAHELDIRRRFEYEEQVRHHRDYIESLPFVEDPPRYNYQTMPSYETDEQPPHYPRSYDSDWLPRHSSAARMEGTSSSAPPPPDDPFETRTMYTSLMESIFGPRPQ